MHAANICSTLLWISELQHMWDTCMLMLQQRQRRYCAISQWFSVFLNSTAINLVAFVTPAISAFKKQTIKLHSKDILLLNGPSYKATDWRNPKFAMSMHLVLQGCLDLLEFYQSGGFLPTAATNNFTNGIISNARLMTEEFSMQLIEQNLKGNIVRLTYGA